MHATGLTQILEILQAHGLMERSDETFISAQDLVSLDAQLGATEPDGDDYDRPKADDWPKTVNELVERQRQRIRDLENRIDNAISALE